MFFSLFSLMWLFSLVPTLRSQEIPFHKDLSSVCFNTGPSRWSNTSQQLYFIWLSALCSWYWYAMSPYHWKHSYLRKTSYVYAGRWACDKFPPFWSSLTENHTLLKICAHKLNLQRQKNTLLYPLTFGDTSLYSQSRSHSMTMVAK